MSRYRSSVSVVVLFGIALFATSAQASITFALDILDRNEPGAPAPQGRVVVDMSVDVSDDDYFTIGFVVGRTFNGGSLLYSTAPAPFWPPGEEDHYVSFGSFAYGRNGPFRFAPPGSISNPGIGGTLIYEFDGPPHFEPEYVNVAFHVFPLPPNPDHPDAPRGRDGYVMRIAIDTTGVQIAGADDPANYRLFSPGEEPAGYLPVFVSESWQSTDRGSGVISVFQPEAVARDWGLYVPEPSTGLLLVLFFPLLLRRRRNRTENRSAETLAASRQRRQKPV